jgi:hypothetical protein
MEGCYGPKVNIMELKGRGDGGQCWTSAFWAVMPDRSVEIISLHTQSVNFYNVLFAARALLLVLDGDVLSSGLRVSFRAIDSLSHVPTDLLEKTSNAVRDLLGGSSGLLVSGPSEDGVNSLVWEVSWKSIENTGRLTKSVLLAGSLAGGGGTGGALSGGFSWSRHDEMYGFLSG